MAGEQIFLPHMRWHGMALLLQKLENSLFFLGAGVNS
jgi:hypothetical protein